MTAFLDRMIVACVKTAIAAYDIAAQAVGYVVFLGIVGGLGYVAVSLFS